MPVARFLVDSSAWARYPDPAVGARLDELITAGVVASCGVVELPLMNAVRDKDTYTTVIALRRASVIWLPMSEVDVRRALEVQVLLVEREESGVPWTALLTTAVAERYGVTMLYANPCFEVIVRFTGQAAEYLG
jgi:predicted nucleic acid-binding protein